MRDLRFTSAKKDWVAGKLGADDTESFWPANDLGNVQSAEMRARGLIPADYTPPAITWADIRSKRDGLLAATDWWAVSDRAMSASETAYRQALRDVPQNFASPADVVWPTKPA
jgi:hypothetical protein